MALTWTPAFVLAAAFAATVVSGVTADSGGPIEFDIPFSTFLQEFRELVLSFPNAVKDIFSRLTHPIRTIGGLIDFFRPDHFIKLPFRHFRCSCDSIKTCSCCLNATIPFFNRSERLCQRLTIFPGNLSTVVNVVSNNRSLIKAVLSGKHPPPLCLPFPPQFPVSALCARLHDLGFEDGGTSFRLCPTTEVQLFLWRLIVVNFECIRVGPKGVKFGFGPHNRTRQSNRRSTTRPPAIEGSSTNPPFGGSSDNPPPSS